MMICSIVRTRTGEHTLCLYFAGIRLPRSSPLQTAASCKHHSWVLFNLSSQVEAELNELPRDKKPYKHGFNLTAQIVGTTNRNIIGFFFPFLPRRSRPS